MPKKRTSQAFETQYAGLNPGQKEAVDTIEGPVMVIAGPGTGKTQVLTLRIANILQKTDTPPSAILALTFTNAAAANMRQRLVATIGSPGYEVGIFTFHSFANYIFGLFPDYFEHAAGFTNASEVEQIGLVRSILDTDKRLTRLVPFSDPYLHIPAIRSAITHLKREGISPEQFRAWIQAERDRILAAADLYHEKGAHKGKMKSVYDQALKRLEKDDELALVYERYRTDLYARKRYDYDDALLMLVQALQQHPSLVQDLQESFLYFLVDEHQDTNGAQNRILELLVSFFDAPNLFVVGDEKQAIFRFQGASLANFMYFEKKFREVKRIDLTVNYRSHQGILDSAHALISHDTRTHNALTAAKGNGDKIKVYTFGTDDEERTFVADSIKKKLEAGVSPKEIAILFRNNTDGRPLAEMLERFDIPFTLSSGLSVLDDADIKKLNILVAAVSDLEDEALATALFVDFLAIDVADAHTIIRAAHTTHRPLYKVLEQADGLELTDPAVIKTFYMKLKDWHTRSKNMSLPHFLEHLVVGSGFLRHIQSLPYHIEKFDKLVALFDEIKAQCEHQEAYGPKEYLAFLSILKEHNVRLESDGRDDAQAVRLMTAHKAKGLEFDYVYIVHAYDGHWGGQRERHGFRLPYGTALAPEEGDSEHDERRLFYVALTRARRDAYISYALHAPDGRARVPSRFIGEIHEELKDAIDGATLTLPKQEAVLFVVPKNCKHAGGPEKYRTFVRDAFLHQGLSPTALNHYLACPWKWFYADFFRMQFVQSIQQMKGTAVHAALQDFFNRRNKETTDATYLIERLHHHLSLQSIPERQRERIFLDMSEALEGYVKTYEPFWTMPTINEYAVRGVALDEDILLSGKIDKMEIHENGKDITVYDYKTGKPKSRNSIEGGTKDSSGDYKRQLVFYKLLLDRHNNGRYHMTKGVIDFIEPNESGNYKPVSFVIEAEETHVLEDEIRRVAQEITTLSFWDMRCDDATCEECALRDLLG